MFDIGFSELLLIFVIGLIVLGPQRLPVAVKTVVGWIRTLRSLATTVQNELTQELKLREFQESLNKVENSSLQNLTPELKKTMDELRQSAGLMKHAYRADDPEKASDDDHTIHNPVVREEQTEETVMAGEPASSSEQMPQTSEATQTGLMEETANPEKKTTDTSPSTSDKP